MLVGISSSVSDFKTDSYQPEKFQIASVSKTINVDTDPAKWVINNDAILDFLLSLDEIDQNLDENSSDKNCYRGF